MACLCDDNWWFSHYLSIPYIPVIGKLLPSPLICIVLLTLFALFIGLDVRTVGDMGQLPDTLPIFLLPDIPLNLETLAIILPYSLGLAAVGLLESMMTATIVDDLTDTNSDKTVSVKDKALPILLQAFRRNGRLCHDRSINY